MLKIGYKSESGAVWLAVATAVLVPVLVPRRLWWAALLLWACASRYVARGARNTARPRFVPSWSQYLASRRGRGGDASNNDKNDNNDDDNDDDDDVDEDVVVMARDMPASARPVAVVTGTNSGIGFYTAVGLAAEGYEVVLTCRSAALTRHTATRVRAAAERQRRAHAADYAFAPQPVCVRGEWPLECDDFASVRAFAAAFAACYGDRDVQVLVNNAGAMHTDLVFSRHCPRLEAHVAANVCGPLLLTELLLPLLARHGGRVVYVSSEGHRFPQMVLDERGLFAAWMTTTAAAATPSPSSSQQQQSARTPSDTHSSSSSGGGGVVQGKLLRALQELHAGGAAGARGPLTARTVRGAFARYGVSKLLNTYHAHLIARRYALAQQQSQPQRRHRGRVYACSLHPGCVATNFSRQLLRWPLLNTLFQYAAMLFLKSWQDGAQTSLHCAMCPRSELALVVPPDARRRLRLFLSSSSSFSSSSSSSSSPSAEVEATKARAAAEAGAISAYFVECANKTDRMLLAYGWDVHEAERVINWCKQFVGLSDTTSSV